MMPTNAEYLRFLPEIILTLTGILIMFLEAVIPSAETKTSLFAPLSIAGLAAALFAAATADGGTAFHDMLVIDTFGTFFRVLVCAIGILAILSSSEYLRRENAPGGEFYALLLFSVMGQCVMVTANELIMIFIGLEISSIASYVLAGYLRDDKRNNESALKYFLLGSFATAFLLYGVAWIYGLTASTNLEAVRTAIATPGFDSFALAGVAAALIFVGLGFKKIGRAHV